jgi:hypothetical protein
VIERDPISTSKKPVLKVVVLEKPKGFAARISLSWKLFWRSLQSSLLESSKIGVDSQQEAQNDSLRNGSDPKGPISVIRTSAVRLHYRSPLNLTESLTIMGVSGAPSTGLKLSQAQRESHASPQDRDIYIETIPDAFKVFTLNM